MSAVLTNTCLAIAEEEIQRRQERIQVLRQDAADARLAATHYDRQADAMEASLATLRADAERFRRLAQEARIG